MEKQSGLDNYGKPKSDYINKIAEMTENKLKEETESKIWLSAYANNNSRSDYHWQVDACYNEIVKRYGNNDIYKECWEKASAGYT